MKGIRKYLGGLAQISLLCFLSAYALGGPPVPDNHPQPLALPQHDPLVGSPVPGDRLANASREVAYDPDSPEEAAALAELSPADVQELELVTALHTTLAALFHESTDPAHQAAGYHTRAWQARFKDAARRLVRDFAPLAQQDGKLARLRDFITHHLSFRHMAEKVRDIARNQGVPAASAVGFGMLMDVLGPAICVAIGHPEIAPMTWLVPFEIPGYTMGFAVQRAFTKYRLTMLYGGKEGSWLTRYRKGKVEYDRIRGAYERNRDALELDGVNDVLIPLMSQTEHSNAAVVEGEMGRMQRLFAKVGLTAKRITYKNLKEFCERNHVAQKLLPALAADKQIPEQMKAVLLLHQIDANGGPAVMDKMREEFSQSFVKVAHSPYFDELAPWVRRFAHVRSLAEVNDLMKEVPHGVPARVVAELWNEALLPMVIRNNNDISFFSTMRLKRRFQPLLVEAGRDLTTPWGPEFAEKFKAYMAKVYPTGTWAKPPSPGCLAQFRALLPW